MEPEKDQSTPTPWWKNPWVLATLAGLIIIPAIRPFFRHVPDPPPVLGQLPEWSLIDQDGRAFGSGDLKGHVYVTSFFFTSCVTICPKIMQAMATLQEKYGRAKNDVRLLSISVDPDTDTPARLRAYAQKVGADSARWTLVRGSAEELEALVVRGFKTYLGQPTPMNDDPSLIDIGHGGRLVLVDGQGRVRGHYETTAVGIDEVFHRAQHVLREQLER